jgi:hypothetical protein
VPRLGGQAVVLLAAASAIVYFCGSERVPR